jgi:hypothetical protein
MPLEAWSGLPLPTPLGLDGTTRRGLLTVSSWLLRGRRSGCRPLEAWSGLPLPTPPLVLAGTAGRGLLAESSWLLRGRRTGCRPLEAWSVPLLGLAGTAVVLAESDGDRGGGVDGDGSDGQFGGRDLPFGVVVVGI